jgi:hypothetical protein
MEEKTTEDSQPFDLVIIIFGPYEVSSVRDSEIQREFERVEIQIQNSRDWRLFKIHSTDIGQGNSIVEVLPSNG